jgi:hypothetical protein
VVRTENAARFWLNDMQLPLIDAWVKSGDDTEFQARCFLTGGTVYPLRLDFSKAKQGVDDSDKQKQPPPQTTSSISLLWKQPTGTLQPVPMRQLSPGTAAEAFVCSTPFPPDDRSYGWERGTAVSPAWNRATTEAAIAVARYVVDHMDELASTREQDAERTEKIRSFCATFAERAFRRPLTDEQRQRFIDRQFAEAEDLETAVKRVVLLVLKSPRFLFREVAGGSDSYDVAARLSFGLWDSIPDRLLWQAAADDQLTTRQQIADQAERMLNDVRAKSKLRHFLLTWLRSDAGKDLSKDPEAFSGFDAAAVADLRTSLILFLDDVVWSEASDFRQLLLDNQVYLNASLADLYQVDIPSQASFTRVRLDDGARAGILTHPYLMASFAHRRHSSPIHRGVFLARGMLGVFLRPPPEAVAPLAADLHPDLTTRQRVTLQTKPTSCMTCHRIINNLGFTLEHFDAAGRYRELDHGKPVDVTGGYQTRTGRTVAIEGARQLAEFLANSQETHEAFAEQMFHHLVQQSVRAYGPDTLDHLRQTLVKHDFHIRKLAIEIMATSAPVGRETSLTARPASSESAGGSPVRGAPMARSMADR